MAEPEPPLAAPELLPTQRSQQRFRDDNWWRLRTEALIELARTRTADRLREEMVNFTHWVDISARHPEICEPGLLARFINEFARLAGTLGEAGSAEHSVRDALDAALQITARTDQPSAALHRAKASYFRSLRAESPERLEALNQALKHSEPGSRDWVGALVDLSEYFVEVSRYREAIRVLKPWHSKPPAAQMPEAFQCGVNVATGVALFTSFRNLSEAERRLEAACAYANRIGEDPDAGAWVARAFHYLARLAEARGQDRRALEFYLRGKEIQERLPEDPTALGFVHLRIAELLAGHSLINTAEEHLDVAVRIFRNGSNQSSGMMQSDLGYAALYAASGRRALTEPILARALERTREIGFWRGEFLCLSYQLLAALRSRRISTALRTAAALIWTLRRGELRRNNLVALVRTLPVMLVVAMRRMALIRPPAGGTASIDGCPCPLHLQATSPQTAPA